MGLFKHKKDHGSSSAPVAASSPTPVQTPTTYHITQSLSGGLTVTPTTPANAYTIALARPEKSRRDSIDICVRCQNTGATVGHCLIQVTTGKFLDCHLGGREADATNQNIIQLKHTGHGSGAKYTLSVPGLESGALRWVHDEGSLHGAMVNAERRLRLEGPADSGGGDEKTILARFAGSSGGVSEFGMLEVYPSSYARGGSSLSSNHEVDWCGLLVLTAVSVYAREERHREKKGKAKGKLEGVGLFGDIIGIATGTGI